MALRTLLPRRIGAVAVVRSTLDPWTTCGRVTTCLLPPPSNPANDTAGAWPALQARGYAARVAVVGGGAAGLTAAYFAALAGGGSTEVLVLERTAKAGTKVLMSGGSRCNVLPVSYCPEVDFFTSSPAGARLAQRVLQSWDLSACREWLEAPPPLGCGIALAEEAHSNKVFPASNSAREVRDRLVAACEEAGVRFQYRASVEHLHPPSTSDGEGGGGGAGGGQRRRWRCELREGPPVLADRVILATGGLSFPKVGTDGTGHRIAEALGHRLTPPHPALTPLCGPHPGGRQLAGVSLDVAMHVEVPGGGGGSPSRRGKKKKVRQVAERGGFLFTHRGYSGPATLDLSHHAVLALPPHAPPPGGGGRREGAPVGPALKVRWTGEGPEVWDERLLRARQCSGKKTLAGLLRGYVPASLGAGLCEEAGIDPALPLAQVSKDQRARLVRVLGGWEVPYESHQGYKLAEVTGGGVVMEEINPNTLESSVGALGGLFLCGELCDVFGRIGGFNFLWAWTSGRLAGLHAGAFPP